MVRTLKFYLLFYVLVWLIGCSEVKEIPRDYGDSLKDSGSIGDSVQPLDDLWIGSDILMIDEGEGPDTIIIKDVLVDYGLQDAGLDIYLIDDSGYPDIGDCPSTIAERMVVKSIDISPDMVNTMGGMYFSYYTPPIIKASEDGYLVAFLTYGNQVRVLGLNKGLSISNLDIQVEANELRGLSVSNSGFAVLIQRGADEMALLGFNKDGSLRFDTTIVGKTDHNKEWAKYIKREWGDYGSLSFYNNQYVAYFGHSMNWGASGEHQGDLLWFFDIDGQRVGGLWDWGCSHSLDVRLAHNSQRLGSVCLSDCYPQKAICFNHRESIIHNEPSGNCGGYSNASLGGLVAFEDGFYHTFISSEGRQSSDVALVKISNNGRVSEPVWITDTPDIVESETHLAKYGEDLIVAYKVKNSIKVGIISKNGDIIKQFEEINKVNFNQQTIFENDFIGNVVWAYGEGNYLNVYIVMYCN